MYVGETERTLREGFAEYLNEAKSDKIRPKLLRILPLYVFAAPLDRYRIITPDLRGHGRSTNPSGVFRFADVARDIFGLLDRLGIDRVAAIGMSAGANTLLHMATQQPSRIDVLIHVSGTPRFPEQARAIMRTMSEDGRSDEEWAAMRGHHVHGDDQIRALWWHARGFADDRQDMNFDAASLSAITARTLVVHGDRDPLYPVELAVELYRAIPAAALLGRAEWWPWTDLRRSGRAVCGDGRGLSWRSLAADRSSAGCR